jgi:hypothetical protein
MDEIMDFEVVKGLTEAPNTGKYMFSEFVQDIFEKASKPLSKELMCIHSAISHQLIFKKVQTS